MKGVNQVLRWSILTSGGHTKQIEMMLNMLESRGISLEKWKEILSDAEKAAREERRLKTAAFLNGYYYRMKYPVPKAM